MKYLMGLILSFTIGLSAFAQDTREESEAKTDQCVQACLDKHGAEGLNQQDLENKDQAESERYENGSVYYHQDPELNESFDEGDASADYNFQMDTAEADGEIDASAKQQPDAEAEESTDVTEEIEEGAEDVGETVVEGAEEVGEETEELFTEDESSAAMSNPDESLMPKEGLWKMANQCALHKELEERSGEFKIKKDLGNAELKVEREKDGEENLHYKSDTEVYTYEKNEKGEANYYYSISKDNEMIEYIKGKDGVTDVIYHGVYNSPEEANQAVDAGIEFEGFSSVCTQ